MFSKSTRAIYKKLSVLGLLSGCLLVFGSSNQVEPVFASVCYQVCEAERAMCDDNCRNACSTSDGSCVSCITQCSQYYNTCMGMAIYCVDGGGSSYNPNCQVMFGGHRNLTTNETHSGYHQDCLHSITQLPCIACPPNEDCDGPNLNTPPC